MFAEITASLAKGEPVVLMTVVRVTGSPPCAPGTKVLIREDGSMLGTFGGADTDGRVRADALRVLREGQPELRSYTIDAETGESVGSCGGTLHVFLEPLQPEPRLIVAGSGQVPQTLAQLVTPLGWRATLLDDRPEFLQGVTLPEGVQGKVGNLIELVRASEANALTAIVIATRDHETDAECLRVALETEAGYVGMMSSPGKARAIFRSLLREGVGSEALERVHTPIGLDLRAKTPQEIALSIAAELVMWRRGGTGASLQGGRDLLAKLRASREDAPSAEVIAEPVS